MGGYGKSMQSHYFGQLRIVWGGIVLLMISLVAHAQFENGSLVGTLRDATGAPVAGADISVTNTATGIENKTKTNSEGSWEIPSLRVGTYRVMASMPGFSNAIADNIILSVGSRQRIDLVLKPGAAQETVEVSDVALQLETESSQRGQVITQYQSEALPLVSRNYADLLGLITGARANLNGVLTTNASSLVRQGSFNINGQRSMYNNFLLDGMDNNAYGESNQGFDNQIISPPPEPISFTQRRMSFFGTRT